MPPDYPPQIPPEGAVSEQKIDPVYKVPIDEDGELLQAERNTVTVIPNEIKKDEPELPKAKVRRVPYVSEVVTALKTYDEATRLKKFRTELHLCVICFVEKQGVDCLQFIGKKKDLDLNIAVALSKYSWVPFRL